MSAHHESSYSERDEDRAKPKARRQQPVWLRLQPKIDFNGPNGCWVWNGARMREPEPYGTTSLRGKSWLAHRLVYTLLVGEIPEGKQLHHTCENQPCVNPMHLEPVTAKQNLRASAHTPAARNAAKTHCPHGHEYTDENTWAQVPKKYPHRYLRVCRTCYPTSTGYQTVAEWKAERGEVAA